MLEFVAVNRYTQFFLVQLLVIHPSFCIVVPATIKDGQSSGVLSLLYVVQKSM